MRDKKWWPKRHKNNGEDRVDIKSRWRMAHDLLIRGCRGGSAQLRRSTPNERSRDVARGNSLKPQNASARTRPSIDYREIITRIINTAKNLTPRISSRIRGKFCASKYRICFNRIIFIFLWVNRLWNSPEKSLWPWWIQPFGLAGDIGESVYCSKLLMNENGDGAY